jgi:hypothetical protein
MNEGMQDSQDSRSHVAHGRQIELDEVFLERGDVLEILDDTPACVTEPTGLLISIRFRIFL